MKHAPFVKIDAKTARRCRELVRQTAEKYGVPPVYITAHVRQAQADMARFEVWRIMISDIGLRRHQIAKIFGRDLRRVRASVVGV